MNFAIAVLIGCVLSFGQEATSSTIDNDVGDPLEDSPISSYTPISPGSRIYFYSIRNGKLLVGPKLKSQEDVTIHTVERNGEPTSKDGKKAVKYSVLKSGVLVPKRDTKGESNNENVYKSTEPTFYVKGFKDILIPINLIYSKSKQKAIIDTEAIFAKQLVEKELHALEEKVDKSPEESTHDKSSKAVKILEKLFPNLPAKSGLAFKPEKANDVEVSGLAPDKNCNGEITMFILKSDGIFQRMPPDPYLPMGIQLSYSIKDSFLIRPRALKKSNEFTVNYLTGKNGDLIPHGDNALKMRTKQGELVSFILGECGSLIPVREKRDHDKHINYYYNGRLIFKGNQFPQIFSNSEFIVINDENHKLPGRGGELEEKKHRIRKRSLYSEEYIVDQPARFYPPEEHPPFVRRQAIGKHVPQTVLRRTGVASPIPHAAIPGPPREFIAHPQPVSFATHHLAPEFIAHHPPPAVHQHPAVLEPVFERQFEPIPPALPPAEIQVPHQQVPHFVAEPEASEWNYKTSPRLRVRTDLYAEDDRGVKIPLIPEVTEQEDVVLYKLTCKGYLVRYPSCKEPEYGFEIHFQLLLDEFILVPISKPNRPNHITYVLQENGDLIPLENNEITFKKAPGSLLYFMLGKNNVLFPIQQKVYPDGSLSFFYQDYHLLKLPNTSNKPLHFSTVSRPLYAFYNGVTVMTISSKPRLNPTRGSNWKNHNRSQPNTDVVAKEVFLSGPSGQLIKVSPFRTKSGSTVLYELDSNGIFYRSPKDKKKCIILKSYILLKEGILLPSNETSGYMYMTSKNGDMFPYLYPNGKLEAPKGESVKYLLCEKGILLPMEIEIVDDHICYFFRDVIVYRERVFCKNSLSTLSESAFKLHYRNDCENQGKFREKPCRASLEPFYNDDGEVVFYKRVNNVLRRHPPEQVPAYLTYTMGSFEVQRDGSLYQTKYQNPGRDIINLMLEPNGDLLEDNRNEMLLEHDYYILDVKGNLIAVEGRKSKKVIYFFKDRMKVCTASLTEPEPITRELFLPDFKRTPLGKDPMKLLEDPEPKRCENQTDGPHSLFIPVPLKSISMPCMDGAKTQEGKSKCDSIKETMALELEINDEVIEEIKNWATKCDKLLSRREVERSLTEVLQGVNVAGLLKDETEAEAEAEAEAR